MNVGGITIPEHTLKEYAEILKFMIDMSNASIEINEPLTESDLVLARLSESPAIRYKNGNVIVEMYYFNSIHTFYIPRLPDGEQSFFASEETEKIITTFNSLIS
jgi:hypothetical protein